MSESDERLVAEIPAELKQLVDADKRTNKEIVESALWREFGGKRQSVIEVQIEQKRSQIDALQSEREELTDEAERLKSEVTALEERADDIEDEHQSVEDDLDSVLNQMEEDGTHMWPDAEPVEDIATRHGLSETAVIERLKKRAVAQDRNLYHTQFKRADRVRTVDPLPITEVYDGE